ncbi:putative photosynthetic complex assembly protein PuhE [Anianabacter salinae]|uniref:putative photosynthetic complex assembly protein PuhE n=1 Tax=Anianabacter salinae TaxID=2851023 RepID=UPI00225E6E37|nr:putative photosynthetic complex assembly protein PuhE [Anianabacter salinae]
MLSSPWIAGVLALFIWWFSTGIILVAVKSADRAGRDGHVLSGLLALPVLICGVWGVMQTTGRSDPLAVYLAFGSALAIWGWIELAFLAGLVTGPNRAPCPPFVPEWERFLRAWGTIAYHEMLLVIAFVWLAWVTRDAVNPFAFWTFGVLFAARISAKLNLFFGVPKINTEFLPRPLAHLPSHFRRGRQSWLFPVSITLLSFATACWLERLYSAETAMAVVGFALLSALTALALLEHWLMVLPLPDEKLWRWMIPAPKPDPKRLTRGDTHGF